MDNYVSEKDNKQQINKRLNCFSRNTFFERDNMITPRISINTRTPDNTKHKYNLSRDLNVSYLKNKNPYTDNIPTTYFNNSRIVTATTNTLPPIYNPGTTHGNKSTSQVSGEKTYFQENVGRARNIDRLSNNYPNLQINNNKDDNNKRLNQLGLMRSTSSQPLYNHKPLYDLKPKDTRQTVYKSTGQPQNYQDLIAKFNTPLSKINRSVV
tara:strand:+ start:348 stop:977 length:630 start_codon:yes stop_codon:yes gene_type:complete